MRENESEREFSLEERQQALVDVVGRVIIRTSIGAFPALILGLIAIFSGHLLPPNLAFVPQTMLLNSINSILDKIASRKEVSDEEILKPFREAFANSKIADLRKADKEIQRHVALLLRRSEVTLKLLEANRDVLHEILEQGVFIPVIATELHELIGNTTETRDIVRTILENQQGQATREQVDYLISLFVRHAVWFQSEATSGGFAAILIENVVNIPKRPSKLVGRRSELVTIQENLRQHKHVLLHGFPGRGKTALAAEATLQWMNDTKSRALWLEAGDQETDSLFAAIARAFGQQNTIAALTGETKNQAVRSILIEHSIGLVIVDNAWNGVALWQLEKVIPPDCALLVTAIRKYPLEVMLEVGQLSMDAALELLSFYVGYDCNSSSDASRLCEILDFLPSAIGIAGANLRTFGLTVDRLLTDIAPAPDKMLAPLQYAEEGHESIAALLGNTLNRLGTEVQDIFLDFGALFSPRATAELLSIYSGREINSVETSLDTLIGHNLVIRIRATTESAEYYQIEGLAYAYAMSSQATDENKYKALNGYLTYARHYSEPGDDEMKEEEYFRALVAELPSFVAALSWGVEAGKNTEVDLLARYLYSKDFNLLVDRGFYVQISRVLEQAVLASQNSGERESQARHLNNMGNVLRQIGQFRSAIERLREALPLVKGQGNRKLEGEIRGNLASAYRQLGEYSRAIVSRRQALKIALDEKDQLGAAKELYNLGNLCGDFGKYEPAIKYFESVLPIARQLDDVIFVSMVLGALGDAHRHLGKYEQALDYHEQALAICQDKHDKEGEATEWGNLGKVCFDMGRYERAKSHHEKSLEIARSEEVTLRQIEVEQLGDLAKAQVALTVEQHIDRFQEALELAQQIGDIRTQGVLLIEIGKVYQYLEQYPKALDYYRQAQVIFQKLKTTHVLSYLDVYIAMTKAGETNAIKY